nr:glycosyltransferase family 61 protein [Neoroseomonas soli]
MLESLARCWAWRTRTTEPVVFHCERPELLPWQAEALRAFGLDRSDIVFVTRCIAFERLVVPQPGYVISSFFHTEHMRALAVTPYEPLGGRKLWISRSRLGEGALGTFENERELEALLQERGWTLLHPQELSFTDQIRSFAGAVRLAGIEGSALHSIVHVQDFRGTVGIVPRTPAGRLNSRNYDLIAKTKGLRQHIYPGPIAQVSGPGAFGRLAIGDVPGCVRFLDEL